MGQHQWNISRNNLTRWRKCLHGLEEERLGCEILSIYICAFACVCVRIKWIVCCDALFISVYEATETANPQSAVDVRTCTGVCVCVFVWVCVFLPPSYVAESLFMTTYLDKQFFLTHLTKKADLCWLGEARQPIKASDSKSNTLSVKVLLSAPINRQKGGTGWWKGGYRTCRQGDLNCAFLSFTITWINVYTEPHIFLKICQLYTKQP